ncbi:MAG: preprotein translocase subunit YajC [Acidobacteriia bacterium]|jgi:preprotein translocase subunit YajC|nr:preprotein translocase subunit YajC [Terriglobia bacterium]|tara:strand:+ start:104 stop:406 length:303 start_codon:yes stop_codon:yes gene_type:complete
MSILTLLAANGQSNSFLPLLPIVAIFLIFYFIVFRPQRRRQQALQEMLKNLKNGDKVITSGGIYGIVAGMKNDTVHLRIADQVKIEISRNAIAAKQEEGP